jgi:hypothetical protein
MTKLPCLLRVIIRGAVDNSANKLTYETDMLVEANETFLKKDKALVGRSLVQASKNVFVRVMNPSADTQIIYPGFYWMCRTCSNVMLYYVSPSIIAI